jgi:hypothetical protein
MSKLTVFTGAGASNGCGQVTPISPPLGRDLYSALEKYEPSFMSDVNMSVSRENLDNFEKKMHEIWNSGKINCVILNAVIASYFSQFRPIVHDNMYIYLIQLIRRKGVDCVYSTLNYDCLMELAAANENMIINYLPDQEPVGQFTILKLHGSCNFTFNGLTGPLGGMWVPSKDNVMDGGVNFIDPLDVPSILSNRPLGPCMSFYMKDKPTPVGRSFINSIQKSWQQRVLSSEKLLIIGVNPNEEDGHIWDCIAKSTVRIGYVGRKSGFERLQKIVKKDRAEHLATDFQSSISAISQFV